MTCVPSTANVMPSGGSMTRGWLSPKHQVESLALQGGAVPDALDLKHTLKSLGHAEDHVVNQGPCQGHEVPE